MDCLVDFEKLPWIQIAEGMRCKTFSGGSKQIRLIELSEGFHEHDWCEKSHSDYIMEGEFTSDFDGWLQRYKKGDIVFIPEGTKHKAVIKSGEKVVMLDF